MSLYWFAGLTAKRDALEAEIKAEGQGHLKMAFDEFFIQHPQIDCVVWNQYTPYFNDGEACVFRVDDPLFILKPAEGEIQHEDYSSAYAYEELPHVQDKPSDRIYEMAAKEKAENDPSTWASKRVAGYEASKDLIDSVNAFKTAVFADDAILEGVFGDHMYIRADRDGFNVEEYDHD